MKQQGVPGAAVAIVENGKVTLARGYGIRRLDSAEPVDADTLFQIGSTTKAFTTAALAILVDEGKIHWDDPVIDHLPGFRMYDPWVTREITIRDLLVHRSGLGKGQGDLLFVPSTNISRADTVRRLRFLKPATSFRSGFAYDNILYIVAGELIEAVSGQTWEAFVHDRILVPAGMTKTVTNDVDRLVTAGQGLSARPHRRNARHRPATGLRREESRARARTAGLRGAIAAGANDLARWLAVQLASGQLPDSDQHLYSAANARGDVAAGRADPGHAAARRARRRCASISWLCHGLGGPGLSRPSDHPAWRRYAGFPRRRRPDSGEERRLRDRQQLGGERVRAGP